MGNAGSAQRSKAQRDRKRKSGDSVDDRAGKNKKPAKGNVPDAHSLGKEVPTPRATNPFIIFFLRLRSKKPKERVTTIARAAGKLWAQMTPEQRKIYIDLANAEKKRRQDRRKKRKTAFSRPR